MKSTDRFSEKEINILLTSEKLFAERGFDATSTREISAAAHTNVSMISYYFGSKEKLFEKLFEYRMSESLDFTQEIYARKDFNEWEKLMMIVERYLGRVFRLEDFYKIMQNEQMKTKNLQIRCLLKNSKLQFISIYRDLVADGYAAGVFSKKPKAEFVHATVVGTIFYAFGAFNLHKDYNGVKDEDVENYRTEYYNELKLHIKEILKNLLGYEKN